MLRYCALFAMFTVACGGGGASSAPPKTPEAEGPAGATPTATPAPKKDMTLDEQVAAGEKTYGERCASCHGAKGAGKAKAPALIGPKALDDYHNGKEAFTYIKDMMPPTAPGSLTDDEYWNVTAFLIKKNDLPIKETLTSATAESVKWSR